MKRTFLLRRNALLSSANMSWGTMALAFAIIVLCARMLAPNFFWYAFAPVFKSADALSAASHSFLQSFSDTAALASQNEKLMDENAALANENKTLSQKLMDIEALFDSRTTGILASHHTNMVGVVAGVIARPPESPYDTLVLAAGADAGVTLGMEAFGNGGVPLGIVSSVFAGFSRVTLFSAPGTNTAGWVGSAALPLTLAGAGAGALNAIVARSAGIMVGDTVFVPGPGQLPIGIVMRIDSGLSSPSVTLHIQPALNPFSVTWVLLRNTQL